MTCGRARSAPSTSKLQWVHSLVAVVILGPELPVPVDGRASMGPQSGSCGYGPQEAGGGRQHHASMGPQSGSCGYAGLPEQ